VNYQERIYNELINENASLWYISDGNVSKIRLKAPTTALKAILKGCKVEFLFGKDTFQNKIYFHTGVSIFDDPINGINILGLDRFLEDHKSLFEILNLNKTFIEFYNELDTCFMHGFVSINEIDRSKVLKLLGRICDLYTGDLDIDANYSLDCFEYSLDNSRKINQPRQIETVKCIVSFSQLTIMNNQFIGFNEDNQIIIDDFDEGGNFEKQVWITLDNIFKFNLHKNPEFVLNNKKRELTDILAFYDNGIFIIETKSMAVLNIEKEQSMDRKVANVQKQILKAIDQVIGAKKVLEKELTILDKAGNEIEFDKQIVPHCIVLVNEIIPFGNWNNIEMKIVQTITDEKVFLNVFEFMEFMKHVKICSGKKELFDYHLIERTKAFMKHKSIFLKAKIINDNKS